MSSILQTDLSVIILLGMERDSDSIYLRALVRVSEYKETRARIDAAQVPNDSVDDQCVYVCVNKKHRYGNL